MSDSLRSEHDVSRRDFMARLAGLSAAWLTAAACARDAAPAPPPAASAHPPASEPAAPPRQLVHFTPAEAADIEAMAARIIPTDSTPGAREAGVVYFIDRALTTLVKEQAPLFKTGLETLTTRVRRKHGRSATFAGLAAEAQDALLRNMEKSDFFGAMRFATIAGFLSLPKYGGNTDYIGWQVIGQEHTFEHKPPFGWYDRPENQQAVLGKVL